MGVGYAIQRFLGLDMPTLTRLNFYLIVPAMIFMSMVESDLTPGRVGAVVGFSVLFMVVLGGLVLVSAVVRGVPRDEWRALLMTAIFYNAGNYGLPLQQLAFRKQGFGETAMAMQVFVMIVQNITSFTVGILLASGGGFTRERLRETWGHIVKFPPVYAWGAGLAVIGLRETVGDPEGFWTRALTPFIDTLHYAQGAFIALALATLGATLGQVSRGATAYPVTLSVVLRLLVGPAVAFGMIKLLGMSGLEAQVILLSTATPTAVNCLLLCVEFDNHPDFVARSVFYSTVLSPVTVTLVVLLAQSGLI